MERMVLFKLFCALLSPEFGDPLGNVLDRVANETG
jgi:hypothetical protein